MIPSGRRSLLVALAAALLVPVVASAQLASRPAAEWIKLLDSPERIAGLQIEEILASLVRGYRFVPGAG